MPTPGEQKVEAALEIAEKARALASPESGKDYGASMDFKIALLPHLTVLAGALKQARAEMYDLKWALHIEVEGNHGEECDCKDHCDHARKLLGDFKCPGVHCQAKTKELGAGR